ncbi:AAA family ATPase [Spirosoma montaniterrae]|uniref:ATPase dynein-related AAA domain-containing protein n=1 Tax=Spirosoma montaniterrae TaxID=1178516 RepID=A0A1P9WZY2_9BACT|nr:AAA family ATPase [Spirosoma montaniterrae]AQG80940.1 hypothetical protein AWR27_17390 [Spirosoma montaniterrae]
MKAIVQKQNATHNNPDIGYVRPVMVEENGRFIPVPPGYFPNTGNILIYTAYHAEINERFLKEELFFLDYTLNPRHSNETPSSCKFSSAGTFATEPLRHQLCRVINKPFDPNRPITLTVEDQPYSYVFLRDDNQLIGPFWHSNEPESDTDDLLRIRLRSESALELDISSDYDNCVFRIPTANLSLVEVGSRQYVLDVKDLLSDDRNLNQPVYYGASNELMDWARRKIGGAWTVDARQLRQISDLLDNLNPDGQLETLKLARLRQLIRGSEEWISGKLPAFARQFLTETEEGRQFLDEYLRNNSNDIYNRQNQEWQRLNDEVRKLNDELRRRKSATTPSVNGAAASPDLVKAEQDKLAELTAQRQVIEQSFSQLRHELTNADDVRLNLLRAKTYLDVLEGRTGRPVPADTPSLPSANSLPTFLRPVTPDARQYTSEVQGWLDEAGRSLEFNDVANYLITLQQSFLTVLAGLPGVGKTSLVTRLAGATGLTNRLLTVPVGRGWTSAADLIGYYNPFTEQFQPARTGLYEVISRLDAEQRRADELPHWVLLDEANLSPLEHYWSDFMRLSDPEAEPVLTLTGANGNVPYQLGQGLRFVATINYDHTTEVLSPRLLDRAAVIRLQASRDLIEPSTLEPPAPLPMLTTPQGQLLFSETGEPFTADEAALFRQLRDVLENEDAALGQPVIISPRKQRAVQAYCGRGRGLLEGDSAFMALDYAVSQHVFPLVNGRGEGFGKRLRRLLELIDRPLPRSARLLSRLITIGTDSYHVYRFFS